MMKGPITSAALSLGLAASVAVLATGAAEALELRTMPRDHIYANAANPGAGQFDAVIHAIGVLNDGTEAITIEAVEIDLIADGISFLTKRVDPSLFQRHTGFLNEMIRRGGAEAFVGGILGTSEGLAGFFEGDASLSAEQNLAPDTAVLAVRHFVAFDRMPETVRITVRTVTASGETDIAVQNLAVIAPETERTYPMPLEGAWYMRAIPLVTSHHRFVPSTEYAIDFFKMDENGRVNEGDRSDPTSYFGYGAEVHAIAPGRVVQVINGTMEDAAFRVRREQETAVAYNARMSDRFGDDRGDNDLASVAGNIVVIEQDDGYYAAYGHLAASSVTVHEGARVDVGEVIAAVGGTGEDNRMVHLHIQLNQGPGVLYEQSVPLRFAEESGETDTGRFIRSE